VLKDTEGNTAIHAVAASTHPNAVETFRALLSRDKNAAGARNKEGSTPLHAALHVNNVEIARILLTDYVGPDGRPKKDRSRGKRGKSSKLRPVHIAASNGNTEMLSVLLEAGADVNASTSAGHRPLHMAAENGHEQAVTRLLAAGADASVTGKDGETPLYLAAAGGHERVVSALLGSPAISPVRTSSGEHPLLASARSGNLNVSQLIANRFPELVTTAGPGGQYALHMAAAGNHVDVLRFLVDHGGLGRHVNLSDSRGLHALHAAASEGATPCVELLLRRGAYPNVRDNENHSPLHLACANRRFDAARALLRAGAFVNAKNNEQLEPIDVVMQNGSKKSQRIIDLLVESMLQHEWKSYTFYRPKWCDICEKVLFGLAKQGLKCPACKLTVHKKCMAQTGQCGSQWREAFDETHRRHYYYNIHTKERTWVHPTQAHLHQQQQQSRPQGR